MMIARARACVSMVGLIVSISMLRVPRISAQEVATSFEQLRSRLKAGDTIQVTDRQGRKTTGHLGALTTSSLELLVHQKGIVSRLTEPDVRKIALQRPDSPLNGALIGLAAGAAPGMLFIAGRSRGSDPIQHADTAVGLVLVPAAIGAGIGALLDAMHVTRTTVYLAPGQRSPRVQFLPLVSKSAAGGIVGFLLVR
jgi:hypothetical protein